MESPRTSTLSRGYRIVLCKEIPVYKVNTKKISDKSPLFTITTNMPTVLDLLLKELIDTYLLTVDHPVDLCQEFRLQLVLRVLLYLVRSLHPQQLLLLQSLWKPNHQQTHLTTSGSWLSW